MSDINNLYNNLTNFYNVNDENFKEFMAEFYKLTNEAIKKNEIQGDLIKELQRMFKEFNENGIDENTVREKVDYFINNSTIIRNIIKKINLNKEDIKNINEKLEEIKDIKSKLDEKADYEYVNDKIAVAQLQGAGVDTSSFITRSDLDKVLIKSINKFNPSTLTKDKYLTSGVLTDYVGWNTTDFIRIQGTTMSCKVFKTSDMDYVQGDANKWIEVNNIYYAFYDSSYQYIPSSGSADTGDHLNQVTIPENAKFIRFSQSNKLLNNTSTLMFAFSDLSGLTTIYDYKKYCVELEGGDYINEQALNQSIKNVKSELSRSVTVKSINRLGYDVYNPNTPPEQTLEGYTLALNYGFDEILCDLRSTSDSVPVCLHDATINRTARNADGSNIAASTNILDITYNQANSYDYGLYKNKKYKGTKLLTLERAIKFAKMNGVTLHIETKCGSSEVELRMIEDAVRTVKRYNMSKFVDWSADHWNIAVLQKIISLDKYANVATMPDKMTNERFNELLNLKTGFNRVFWFAWDTSTIDDDMLNRFINNEIYLEIGTFNDAEKIKKLFDSNLRYVTGISSDKLVARNCLK